MSKSKKVTPPTPPDHEGKGFFALAGEAFAVLGEEIAEGKDKVVDVAAAKITAVKKAINKITHKKAAGASRPAKKSTIKKAAKKAIVPAKKAGSKLVKGAKKVAKKAAAAPKKVAKKAKPAPKKAPKKKTSGRTK